MSALLVAYGCGHLFNFSEAFETNYFCYLLPLKAYTH